MDFAKTLAVGGADGRRPQALRPRRRPDRHDPRPASRPPPRPESGKDFDLSGYVRFWLAQGPKQPRQPQGAGRHRPAELPLGGGRDATVQRENYPGGWET